MSTLVTGGAGFIGSHLCEQLIKNNKTVICLDNLNLGSKKNVQHLLNNKLFIFKEGNVLDKELMKQLCQQYSVKTLYHFAANSDIQAGGNNLNIDLDNTFQTTINCLDCIQKYGVEQFIFASSSAVYGDYGALITEESGPCRPISFYGAAKLASEHYIHAMLEQCSFKAWIIRFPNVVGKRLTHGVIYDFINKLHKNPNELEILGDGNQCKPYMIVDDLLNGIFLAQKKLNDPFNVINLGVDTATTVTHIATLLINYMNLKNVNITYTGGRIGWTGDVANFKYDLTKMNQLGWQPTLTSDQAVQYCIKEELKL